MAFRTLDEADLNGKRVLLRVDLNVPMEDGRVTDATRIERVAGTIREIAEKGGRVILLAHFGRPKGRRDTKESLRPVAAEVEHVLGQPVAFAEDCIGPEAEEAVAALKNGQILLLENTRFHAGEEANDEDFVTALAALGDVYVNDAFSAAHRAHASTEGLASRLPAYAGRTMQSELAALTRGLESPERPVVAVVGGAKVSTKIDLLENLVAKVDSLVIGGGMANTFLSAIGYNIGRSLAERDLAATAMRILDRAKRTGCAVFLPVDGVVATEFKAHAPHRTYAADMIPSDGMILDVGSQSVDRINAAISDARTLVWNGPLGAFEIAPFDQGTVMAARHAADRTRQGKLVSIAGGGDTVAALNHAGVADKFTYVSTAGGAFLEWLEGKSLPGVEALRKAPAADEGPQEPPEAPPGGAVREARDPEEPANDQAPEPAETAAVEDAPKMTANVAETPSREPPAEPRAAAKKRAAAKAAPTRKSAPTKKAAEAARKVVKRSARKAEKTSAKKPAAKAPAKKTPAAGSSGAAAKAPVRAPARTAAKAGAKTAKKSAGSAPSKAAAKKAPAAKTAAKKTAAKKTAAKRSPARATSARKTSVRKTSVKKTPAKKAQATKPAVKKASAKKTPARKSAAKNAAVRKTPARKSARAPARPAKTSKATAASRRAKAARPAATARASKSAKSTRAAKVAKPVKSAKAAKAAKPTKRSAKARPAARNSKARRR